MKIPSILFQVPWASVDSPAAVNIWVKNLARAFCNARFSARINYVSSKRIERNETDGVQHDGIPVFSRLLLSIPKIRSRIIQILQLQQLKKSANQYSLVSPIGGPYTVTDEVKRRDLIAHYGSKYFHPILEDPSVRTGMTDQNELKEYVGSVSNLYDVLLPITTYLKKLYEDNGRTKPTLLNPIIVDAEQQEFLVKQSNWDNPRFVYTGNLRHDEEMELLLSSFAVVSKLCTGCHLDVIGGGSSRRETRTLVAKYQDLCRRLGILERTDFLGVLPHQVVMKRYSFADAFLLPRPFRPYSKAGFPSKLGEYLLAGKPVISTATGDIPLYLEDGVSAYLVENDSSEAFSDKILRCVKDSDSLKVGMMGREVALDSFSIEATSKRLRSFFMELGYYE